jgi:hypothetical protein
MSKIYAHALLSGLAMAALQYETPTEANTGAGAATTDNTPQQDTSNIINGKEFKYFFKTPTIKDENGKEIGKGKKHPDVKAVLPVPTPVDIINYLSHSGEVDKVDTGEKNKDGTPVIKEVPTAAAKVARLIMEGVEDMVFQAGRAQINDWLEKNQDKNPDAQFSPTLFDLSKVGLEYIATLERGQRGAWAPSEDDLKAFCEDYTMIFVNEINYDPKKVKVHCDQFEKGLAKLKNDKPAVKKMQEFLNVWATKTSNMEVNADTYEWLQNRAKKYLAAEEKNYADAL